MRKICVAIAIFSLLLLASFKPIFAAESCGSYPTEELKKKCEEIESQIKEYEKKLQAAQETESALKKNIEYYDNQIYLAKLRINESEIIIEKRKQDVENLVNKIIILEDRLDKNTKLFLRRINLSYRKGALKPYMVFLTKGSLSDKVSRYKYLQTVQSADRKFLFRVQETKNSYSDQKKLVAAEKKALENEKIILEARKTEYNNQVKEKELALSQTQDEEQVLSAEIENLRAQRSNLMGGVVSLGYSYDQNTCQTWAEDNFYFNQTDCRWGGVKIGNANCPNCYDSFMGDYGCAVTSSAMVLKKSGKDVNPGTIAGNSSYFLYQYGYQWDLINWAAVGNSFFGHEPIIHWSADWSLIDTKLNEGKWAIVHVPLGKWGHFVVVTGKEGNDYKIHDPFFKEKTLLINSYGSIDQVVVYE